MLLLGPGKSRISQKSHKQNFYFMYAVTKFLVQKKRISQILVIVLKNRSNEIRSNEIRIRQELPVISSA